MKYSLLAVFVFQHFEYIILLIPGLEGFCWEICWWSYEGVLLEVTKFFSSAAFKILLLLLIFEFFYNVSWEGSFKLILFGDLWVSWTWVSISLPRFGMFLAIISLNKLSPPFSLSACLGTLVIHKLVLRMVSYRSYRLSSTLFILFTLCSFDMIFSKFLSSVTLFFLLIDQVHC